MTFEVISKSHPSLLFSFKGFFPCFTTPLAEQGGEAEKGKGHLIPLSSCTDGAALGCWHCLRPDAVTLLCWVGLEWGPKELLHPLVPLAQLP